MVSTAGPGRAPEYPAHLVSAKVGGTVHVELTFTTPDGGPKARISDDNLARGLVAAVAQHVDTLRLPCLPAGETAVLRQDYVFVPNDGRKVASSYPEDAGDAARRQTLACMRREGKSSLPEYPRSALEAGSQGRVYASLRFVAADLPPEVTLLSEPRDRRLGKAVREFVQDFRLPCLEAGKSLDAKYFFRFILEGARATVLEDVGLVTLLKFSKDVPSPAYFNLNSMGCPFDVRLTYWQPHAPNEVAELQEHRPERSPLLDWMTRLRLDLSDDKNAQVLGDTTTVTVPCGTIDL